MAGTNGVGRFGVRSYVAPASLSSIVANGLVLNLDAGNLASYPGTGTAWTDLSGNGNNGTLVNGTSYSSSNGGTLAFDGINDYISLNSNSINSLTRFTFNIWFKTPSIAKEQVLFSTVNSTQTMGYHIEFYNSKILMQVFPSGGYTYASSVLSSNTWYNITVSYDNGNIVYYKNGIQDGSATRTFNVSTATTFIGKWGGGAFYDLIFGGNIAHVSFYDRPLTSAEVATNFDSTKSRFGFASYTTRTVAFATATGITDTTILNALNTFDAGLISNGLDTDLEVLYPFVGGTSTSHQYNFINPSTFPLTFNGGWIHSSTGAKPNGTNAYAQTGWVPSSRYSNGTTNGAWGTYIRQSLTAWPQFALGSYAAGSYFGLAGNNTTSQYWRVNGEANTTPATTSNKGMFQASRALTSTNMFVSQNSQQFELSGIFANGGIPNVEVYLASNNNGGAVQFGSQEQALAYLSKGKYTQAQQSAFYALVQAFQTSLSRAV